MSFHIIRNDITLLEVDAIVNAANSALKAGGGVCGAIFLAAGKEQLQSACDKIGFCKIGDAVITKGFSLKASYIIHTVGPVYGENPLLEEEQLYSCYKSSLELAKRKRLKSIAFPVISSGIFAYPKAEAIKIATRAIKDFLLSNEMTVYLVVYDKDTFRISEKLFSAVESYIDERMIKYDLQRRQMDGSVYSQKLPCTDFENDGCIDSSPEDDFAVETSAINFPCAPSALQKRSASFSKRTLESLLNRKNESFSQMLLRLIDEKGMSDVEVYKRANIDRKLFSKIRKHDYKPGKTTVVALAIGLRLNIDETKDLLRRAGFALSDYNKFDIIIEYFIEHENYDIFEINETLFAFDQQMLGA